MTTQIDHEEARRHLDVVRYGKGITWMSDLDPLDIVEGLLDAYDNDIAGFFTQEEVDAAVEEAKDQQKGELDEEHQREIQLLREDHGAAIAGLQAEHGQAIARLTAGFLSFDPTLPIRMETIKVSPAAERPPLDRSPAADLESSTHRPKRPIGKLGAPRRAREPRAIKHPREPRIAAAPSSTGTLAVVLAVLTEAGIGVALSANDIVARAGERLPTKSKTPTTVVSRDLALDIKRHGAASHFRRTGPGFFRLAMAHERTATETAATDPAIRERPTPG